VAVAYDEIGIWSEVKLAIIKEYASAKPEFLMPRGVKRSIV